MATSVIESARSRVPLDDVENDYLVEIEGESYPPAERSRKRRPTVAVAAEVTPARSAPRDLSAEVFRHLWHGLPLARRDLGEFRESAEVVDSFVESSQLLERASDEINELVKAICSAHLEQKTDETTAPEISSDRAEQLMKKWLGQIHVNVSMGNELDAKNVARPVAEVHHLLLGALKANTRKLIADCFGSLDKMVDLGIVGVIKWYGDSNCRFHYFRRTVESTLKSESRDRKLSDFRNHWATETTKRVRKGKRVVRHVRYEQQLQRAESHHLGSPTLLIPSEIRPLIEQLPPWLKPFLRVAAGQCFRERVIPRIEENESWQQEEVIEQVRLYFDPALTLGHYVLWGWGETEHAREQSREAWRNLYRTSLRWAGMMGTSGVALAIVGMIWLPQSIPWAWVAGLGAAGPLNVGLYALGRLNSRPFAASTFILGNLGGVSSFCGVLGMATALPEGSPWLGLLGITMFVVGTVAALATFLSFNLLHHQNEEPKNDRGNMG